MGVTFAFLDARVEALISALIVFLYACLDSREASLSH